MIFFYEIVLYVKKWTFHKDEKFAANVSEPLYKLIGLGPNLQEFLDFLTSFKSQHTRILDQITELTDHSWFCYGYEKLSIRLPQFRVIWYTYTNFMTQ